MAKGTSTSSGYTSALQPKPPPTSGVITRTDRSARPSIPATMPRRMWGHWLDAQIVISPVTGSRCAATPRVSSGMPV